MARLSRVATGGGVRTQVWVVRPDGTDARLRRRLGETLHAELGPWTRSGHRVSVSVPGEHGRRADPGLPGRPGDGALHALASGELISVLDLSVDEDFVVLRDGQRGRAVLRGRRPRRRRRPPAAALPRHRVDRPGDRPARAARAAADRPR